MNVLTDLVRTMEHVLISSIVTNVNVWQDLMEPTAQKVSKLYIVFTQNSISNEKKMKIVFFFFKIHTKCFSFYSIKIMYLFEQNCPVCVCVLNYDLKTCKGPYHTSIETPDVAVFIYLATNI